MGGVREERNVWSEKLAKTQIMMKTSDAEKLKKLFCSKIFLEPHLCIFPNFGKVSQIFWENSQNLGKFPKNLGNFERGPRQTVSIGIPNLLAHTSIMVTRVPIHIDLDRIPYRPMPYRAQIVNQARPGISQISQISWESEHPLWPGLGMVAV